jgi:cell division topological specificity factor
MFDFFSFFNRIFGGSREDTRSAARDRLRLVLVSDRATVAPQLMESLRNELIEVISRYMEIDTCSMQMGLERHEGVMALAANIPVRSVHRSSAEMAAVSLEKSPVAPRQAQPEVVGKANVSKSVAPVAAPAATTTARLENTRLVARRRNRRRKRHL